MKKKLVALTLGLGLASFALSVPPSEAIGFCSAIFCASRPATTRCACPPGTDRVGSPSSCGTYTTISATGCWYE